MQTVKHATKHKQVMQLVRRPGIVRPRDARAHGLPGDALWLLARRGLLEQRGRGIEGVTVPVYDVAKTVADCFKYRNKIGVLPSFLMKAI